MSINAAVREYEGQSWTAFLSEADGGWTGVVLADAVTGGIRGLREHRVWAISLPSECLDDPEPTFCIQGMFNESGAYGQVRVDVNASTIDPVGDYPQPTNSRMVGDRVYSTNERSPEETEGLGYIADGKVLWEYDYHDLFGPDTSSDAGWAWYSDDDHDPVVGLGHIWRDQFVEQSFTFPLSDSSLVAISKEEGEILWRSPATDLCPFAVDNYLDEANRIIGCRYASGEARMTWEEDGSLSEDYKDVAMSLVGLDLHEGTTVWEHRLSADLLHAPDKGWSFVSQEEEIIIPSTGTSVTLVDPRTGAARPAEPQDLFVCERDRERFLPTWGDEPGSYGAGKGRYPCDQSGAELPDWTASQVEQAGRLAGEVHVISMPDRLIGVRVA
ncbi:hypothetical protein P0D62_02110 [Tessaracoccus sp. HF-7]|nr:hypothetical protein [Tessaracoccus caeni]